jgi:hypothetical protein
MVPPDPEEPWLIPLGYPCKSDCPPLRKSFAKLLFFLASNICSETYKMQKEILDIRLPKTFLQYNA